MDRYFDALSKNYEETNEEANRLELNELHLIGIVSMFIASKYEDVYPLLMKTVVKKIGHEKITDEQIRMREAQILMALDFKIGSLPTTLEFLDSYIGKVFPFHEEKEFIQRMSVYLAMMCTHHD